MTPAQHVEGMIVAQRKLLWPLSPGEREHRIAEIRADYEYEETLRLVAFEMAERDKIAPAQPLAATFISALAVTVFLGACGVMMILAATPVPA